MSAEDARKALEMVREKADLFVRVGFRDEDGVWHVGPHRIEFDAALATLTEHLERLEQKFQSEQETVRVQLVRDKEGLEEQVRRLERLNARLVEDAKRWEAAYRHEAERRGIAWPT